MKKTQHSQSRAMRVQDCKTIASVGSWNTKELAYVHLTNALIRSKCKNLKRYQTNRTRAYRPSWVVMASEKAKLLCFFLQFLHRLVVRIT